MPPVDYLPDRKEMQDRTLHAQAHSGGGVLGTSMQGHDTAISDAVLRSLHWHGMPDVGRMRAENQDAFAADPEIGLFVVSDGMGGTSAGKLAAEAVVGVLPKILKSRDTIIWHGPPSLIRRLLEEAICALSEQLRAHTAAAVGPDGVGATVVAVLVSEGSVHIAHLGDSRAYLLRQGKLTQLTEDHSLARLLVQSGVVTMKQARHLRIQAGITRFVGMPGDAWPKANTQALEEGDVLLLCTDGLTKELSDSVIGAILQRHPDPPDACRRLIAAVNDAAGSDNITAVVVKWGCPDLANPSRLERGKQA
jgi:protein phosphatase